MADTKISALATAATLGGGEAIPLVQAGATVRATPAQIAAFARAHAVEPVDFSTTPPLDGAKLMTAQAVSGPIAFTAPAAPVAGASCYVRLAADGTNVPSFPAASFVEHGSSAGYLNLAGAVNLVEFWFDGTVIYYAINQSANVAPFAASTAYVPNPAPATIVLTFAYALNGGSVPAGSAFAVTASGGAATVTAVTVGARAVTLALSRAIAGGETVSIVYTPPAASPLADGNGNVVLTSSIVALNGVLPAGQKYLRFAALKNESEAANAVGGYDYAPTASASEGYDADSGRGTCTGAIPAGADGFFLFQAQGAAVSSGLLFGLSSSAAIGGYGDVTYAIYANSGSSYAAPVTGGTAGAATMYKAGHWLRMTRTGTTILCELSADNRATWTTLYTWTNVATGALYPAFVVGSPSIGATALLSRPIGSANVA